MYVLLNLDCFFMLLLLYYFNIWLFRYINDRSSKKLPILLIMFLAKCSIITKSLHNIVFEYDP